MPIALDGVLEATFEPGTASVLLAVDGAEWPTPVNQVTVTREVPGEASVPLRGVELLDVVGGSFVGSDHEMPLDSTITYTVDGYLDGVFVSSSTVAVDTAGAAVGLWLKAAGLPNLTVRCDVQSIGDVESVTVGGVYQIAGGGGAVAQTTAQWSGLESDRLVATVRVPTGSELARVRALLSETRIALVQGVGVSDVDAGWYFVGDVVRSNPGQFDDYPYRMVRLRLQRTGVPAGTGRGVAGRSWAALASEHPTWADVDTAFSTWFDVLRGA